MILQGEERRRIPELVAMAKQHREHKPYRPSRASAAEVSAYVDDRLREAGIIRSRRL